MPREKPILFSTPMVQGLMREDGPKTQTRRIIRPQPLLIPDEMLGDDFWHLGDCQWLDGGIGMPRSAIDDFAPYQPGDILWVRETWRAEDYQYIDGMWSAAIRFKAGGDSQVRVFWKDGETSIYERTGWRPSIHMPKEAARLFLRVTDVRAERVQDISPRDVLAEGIVNAICERCLDNLGECLPQKDVDVFCGNEEILVDQFAQLWDSINALRGFGWEQDPWVWAYTFERSWDYGKQGKPI